jgi:hypothetical protein
MSAYFVFVRFFLGYTERFPFERFAHLGDDEINDTLEELRKEWLSEPANARSVETSRRELQERQRTWSQSFLAKPGRSAAVPPGRPDGVRLQPPRTGEPSFDEVATLAGWRAAQMSCGDSAHGITHGYPLARFSTKEDADAAAEALRDAVAELARGAYAKQHWNDDDDCYLHATANPRFVVVAEGKLSRSELARAHVRIRRLDGAPGEQLPPEEALLRLFLPTLRATLDQIEALSGPTCAADGPDGSRLMASAASTTTPADDAQPRPPLEQEAPCYDQHLRRVHPEAADTIADAVARKLARPGGPPAPSPGKQRRGRKPDPAIDPKKDKRLCEDWQAAKRQGMTRQAFARERGIPVQDLIDAQNREKYRRRSHAE